DIETEPAGVISADARGGQARKQIADGVEHAGVGGGIAARCAANGRLIDDDDLVEAFEAFQRAMRAGAFLRAEKFAEQGAAQNVVNESAFSRTADAGDAGERAERDA